VRAVVDRRTFLGNLTGCLLAAPLAAEAQPAGRPYKIAYLTNSAERTPVDAAFLDALRELGYIDGQNVSIDARYTGGRPEVFARIVSEVADQRPDVIFVWSAGFAQAVKNGTKGIPIVFAANGPVENGLVQSIARPGGNVTGATLFGHGFVAKQLSILRELVPAAARVALLANTASLMARAYTAEAIKAGPSLKITVELMEANSPEAIEGAFLEVRKRRIQAVLVTADTMYWSIRERIVQAAAQSRVPAMYWAREYVEAGGLISYAANLAEIARVGARYVAQILKGVRPADLPVQDPTKFDLLINLKTAKALGLTIPQSLLHRADQVIDP
jgi:putative ABC transport system substrate-binding protein